MSSHKNVYKNPNNPQYNDELYIDMRKYGIENFNFEILEEIALAALEEKWIQHFLSQDINLYNINLYPHSNSQYNKRSIKDINLQKKIISVLKENILSNIEIAKLFNCSDDIVYKINHGIYGYSINGETYPIRKFNKNVGGNNPNSLYTDDEVLELRKKYVNESLKNLFKKYGRNKSLEAFENIVIGVGYKHLPIYKKRQKIWVKDNKPYRLEP
jgi:hypothetical protein